MVGTEDLVEEHINGFSALSPADPYDARSVQIINDGGIFAALAVGDFINVNAFKIPNPVSLAQPVNGAVKLVGKGRFRNMQDPCSRLLSHQLAIQKHRILEAIGDTGIGICPRDELLDSTMLATQDFSWTVVKPNRPPTDGNVLPQTMIHRSNDPPPSPAFGAKGAILKGLDPEMKFPIPESKLKIGNQYLFQLEQFSDKLADGHRFCLLLHGFVVNT